MNRLTLYVLVALVLGAVTGVILGPDTGWFLPQTAAELTEWLALPGMIFLAMVKMIVLPLIFSSIILGIVNSGDPSFLRRVGPRLLGYFVGTTAIAVTIGICLSYLFQPGTWVEAKANGELNPVDKDLLSGSIPEQIARLIPSNIFASLSKGDTLAVVVFSVFVGVAALIVYPNIYRRGAPVLQAIQDVSMQVVTWALKLVPLAVFGLIAQVAAKIGLSSLAGVAMYMVTVVTGLLLLYVMYIIIILLFTRQQPLKFITSIWSVQLIAFASSSSAATMPFSIKAAEEKLGIRATIANFFIPVGATINMDGTALYQVVATVFLSQVYDIDLSLVELISIAAITIGASIGTPAAPGVGIIVLATILASAGIPEAGIGLILGVDRILDMLRTAINVSGDLTACSVFEGYMKKELDVAPPAPHLT